MPPFRISGIYFAAKEDGGGGDSQSYMQSSSEIVTTNKSILTFLQTRCPSCRTTNSIRAMYLSVYLSVSLSRFILTAIFPGTPGLTGYIGAKDEGSDGDNWSYETCLKLQSNHHHQHTNIQPFTGRMPFLSPNQQCQSTERNAYRKKKKLTNENKSDNEPGYLGHPDDVRPTFSARAAQPTRSAAENRHRG